jgi:hypothetical protein
MWQKYRGSVQVLPLLWKTFAHRGAYRVPKLCQTTCVILPR